MGVIDVYLSARRKVTRKPKDGTDAGRYEILLDTDSVALQRDTRRFAAPDRVDDHLLFL